MSWFLIALGAVFLWSFVNLTDNYLVIKFSQKNIERSSGGLVIFSSFIGVLVAIVIAIFTSGIFEISNKDVFLLVFSGALSIVWIILYLYALEISDASSTVSWFLVSPIFGYILGYLFLGETLTLKQFIGSAIILLGAVLISLSWEGKKQKAKKKFIFYMLAVCLVIAISGIIFKFVALEGNFWVSSFWQHVGLGGIGIIIYFLSPKYRREFKYMNQKGGFKIFLLNLTGEIVTIFGNLLNNYALLLAPVAMVYLVGSFQPAIVLVLAIISTKFLPKFIQEDISRKVLIPKIVAILLMILGSAFLFL